MNVQFHTGAQENSPDGFRIYARIVLTVIYALRISGLVALSSKRRTSDSMIDCVLLRRSACLVLHCASNSDWTSLARLSLPADSGAVKNSFPGDN
jgi:hypothetical protein